MLEFIRDQFFTPGEGFMPHGMCLSWQPGALWLNVAADALIVFAYLCIPFILMTIVRRRDDLAFKGVVRLFACFIFFCAVTHATGIWVVWFPDFIAQGLLKLIAAGVSLATAFVLWRLIPTALAIPNPSELEEANAKLAEANATLEANVQARTQELEDTRHLLQSMMDAMPVEVAHRDRARRLKFWNGPFGARFHADTGVAVRENMPHEEMFLARMQAKGVSVADCEEAWEEAALAYDDLQPREIHINGRDMLVLRTPTSDGGVVSAAMDVSRVKRAERALAARSAELERSNAELAQFAHVASHDLQEPLRTISSYLKLLHDSYQSQFDDQARLFMRFAMDGAGRMQELIKDLMAYSRAGADPTLRTSVPLYGVLEDVEGALSDEITKSDVTILADTLPTIMGDKARVTQLVRHLLDNAIKYRNGERPMARLSAERGKGEWVIAIEDNGIGIALEYQEQIFDMFQRLHLRDEYPGAGIGLAIAKRIVEGFGGRIWVDSVLGVGSTFYFTVPDSPGDQNEDAHRFGQAARGQSNPGLAG